jgi:hypothetical protein
MALAVVALRQLVATLRLLEGQREMASRTSARKLNNFVRESQTLLGMVQRTPSALELSPLPELAWAYILDNAKREEDKDQKLEMVVEGLEYCKLTWDLLNNQRGKHKAKFCADLTPAYVNLFRQQCYSVWSMVEEGCPSLGKRKQSCW